MRKIFFVVSAFIVWIAIVYSMIVNYAKVIYVNGHQKS